MLGRAISHSRSALCAVMGTLACACGEEPLAEPLETEPLVIEVLGVSLWDDEINAAVAAMERQMAAAGGVGGQPVEFRVTVIGSPSEIDGVLDAVAERFATDPPFGNGRSHRPNRGGGRFC